MSKKIALWIKGGITSLSFFLLMTYVISPLLNSIKASTLRNIIAEIINAPFLIISIPLFIVYSLIGFGLDAIFNTEIGYESLSLFPIGVIFMEIFSIIYFFMVGVFIVKIYKTIKKKK